MIAKVVGYWNWEETRGVVEHGRKTQGEKAENSPGRGVIQLMNTPSPTQSNMKDASYPAAQIDLLTVSAIAIVAYLIAIVVHELLGHGLASILVGLHVRRVTSVDVEVNFTGVPTWKVRVVAAAGSVANLLSALIVIMLIRVIKVGRSSTRYFLWLLATICLLQPGGYLMTLSLANVGDWNDFVQGLPFQFVWRIVLTTLGIIISFLGLLWGIRNIDPFLGRNKRERHKRALVLTLTAYLVGSTVNTLAGAFNPTNPVLILTSAAAASFGGTIFLLWINPFVGTVRSTTLVTPLTPTRNWFWVSLGVVALVVYFAVLGPGLPR